MDFLSSSRRTPLSIQDEHEVAPFAAPYVRHFREILEILSLCDGFTLLPVETPSADVTRAMADWLSHQGYDVDVVAPEPGSWQALPAKLFALSTTPQGVVVVVGPRAITPDLRTGLRLLNQRRDSLARHLGRPLVWSGSRAFFEATWELAPDFWSIRELPQRLSSPGVAPASSRAPQPGTRPAPSSRPLEASPAPSRAVEPRSLITLNEERTALLPETLQGLLDATNHRGDQLNAARLKRYMARLLLSQNKTGEAITLAQEALADLERMEGAGNAADAARCHVVLGDIAVRCYEYAAAALWYRKAQTIFERIGDPYYIAKTAYELGRLADRGEDREAARSLYARALDISERIGDVVRQAKVLKARGDLGLKQGDLAGAVRDYEASLDRWRALHDRLGEAAVLKVRGDLRVMQADLTGALEDYESALCIFREHDERVGEANALLALGDLERQRDDLDAALQRYSEAEALYRRADAVIGLANVRAEAARVLATTRRHNEAIEAAKEAQMLGARWSNSYARELAEDVLAGLGALARS